MTIATSSTKAKAISKQYARIEFDGGSRGNPGLAAGAAVITYEGKAIEASKLLRYATNNEGH